MKRYKINESDSKGTVVWHSLNENGDIGVYDVQFGDTIIKNLLAEEIEPVVVEGHGHPPKKRDDEE